MEIIKGAYGVLMYKVKFEMKTGYEWGLPIITPIGGSMKDNVTYIAFYFPAMNVKSGNENNLKNVLNWFVIDRAGFKPIGRGDYVGSHKGYPIIQDTSLGYILPLVTGITTARYTLQWGVDMVSGSAWDDTAIELTGFLIPQPIS